MSISARNRANKRKGARWETDLLNGLRGEGYEVERLRLAGREDEGDLVIRTAQNPEFLVVEAKNAAMNPAEFTREAIVEADNFAKRRNITRRRVSGVAVVKRRNANWRDAYVVTTLREFLKLSGHGGES